MSNSAIVQRIIDVIEAYEKAETSASSIADRIELHEPALESVPREIRDRLHSLSVEVIEQDVTPFEEEQLGLKMSRVALNKLKIILSEIQ